MGEMDESVKPILRGGYWSGRRVLVTGGTGFIGTGLCRALLTLDADVHVLADRTWIVGEETAKIARASTLHLCDIRNFEAVRMAVVKAEPQTVFHLAAISQVGEARLEPRQTFEINTMGLVNLIEALRMSGSRPNLVVASTDKAFGEGKRFDFRSAERPKHPYDASKLAADVIAAAYRDWAGLPVRILRTCNVFGPFDTNWRRIVPGAVRAAWRDEILILRSDGTPLREYVFLDDAVEAYLRLAEHWLTTDEEMRPYVLAGHPMMVAQIARKVMDLMASSIDIVPVSEVTDEASLLLLTTGGPTAILDDLALTPMEPALIATIAWLNWHLGDARPYLGETRMLTKVRG